MAASMRTAARFTKFLPILRKRYQSVGLGRRSYLSSAYACNDEWTNQRRSDPLLQIGDKELYFVDVSKKFISKAKENLAVDVDIFVNAAEEKSIQEEVEKLLNRLRRSKHTIHTLESTACATVRYMLSIGQDEKLVQLLEDKLGFGLFPDVYTMNFLLNYFLTKEGREREAAKVAAEMMLQEDPGNEITRVLSLIACIKYLSAGAKASPWMPSKIIEEKDEDEEDEVKYVRVPNLTNFFFDDHFDLTDPDLVVGKTLLHFSKSCQPGLLKDSIRLVGLTRKGQWEKVRKEISNVKEICADVKELCTQRITEYKIEGDDVSETYDATKLVGVTSPDISELLAAAQKVNVPDWLFPELEKLKVNSSSLLSLLEARAKNLAQHEASDIESQKSLFAQWVQDRKASLEAKHAALDRVKRIEAIRAKKKELAEKEELYYAFENWNKLEIILAEVEKNEVRKEKIEEYVPPEVKKRQSVSKQPNLLTTTK
ncbi:hypothetical protein BIW11_05543 [Tropilaelaps mercedesae]|uniref:28S ribosomal protein S27 n=1 Tax=Tropilaelaps mercedesae TaxID=418985 RepID=A0A1V9Y1U3_9ACAR|nr:hypothetical protein BIW11_05543 [Tropilaelaps mercedesae]